METGLKELKCGQCGNVKHELYLCRNGEILAKCTECKSVSRIALHQPAIEIKNESGMGTLCVFD